MTIEFKEFWFKYSLSQKWNLENINLKINRGEFVLVIGPSGCGKTTFLRAINGLIPHFYSGKTKGYVTVNGLNTTHTKPNKLASYVATIFQDPENQIVMNTVEREIGFPLENLGLPEYEISKRVEEALDLVGIASLRNRRITELSGGEKQKVAIASSIATYPNFILLDEPTSQLSPNSAEEILGLLERLNDDFGLGIILVEHRLERTLYRADRLIVFSKGKIIGDGEPRLIASQVDLDMLGIGLPQVSRVALYLHKNFLPLTVKEGRRVFGKELSKFELKLSKRNLGKEILRISNIYFSYNEKPIIKGISLNLRKGEILGIIGRNGVGKTTLAKLITGILKPEKGKIIVDGKNIEKLHEKERSKEIGLTFQNPNLHLFGETLYEDVSLGIDVDNEIIKRVMTKLGIWEMRNRNSRDLSGGERMLTAIASIAVLEPKILILDEPTRGLSYAHKINLSKFLKEYSKNHSVILISHDMEMMARTVDVVAIMANGKVIVIGDKREVMPKSLNYTTQLNKLLTSVPSAEGRILVEEDIEGFE